MIPIEGSLKRSESDHVIPDNVHENQDVQFKVIDIQNEEYSEDFTDEVTLVNDSETINKNFYLQCNETNATRLDRVDEVVRNFENI